MICPRCAVAEISAETGECVLCGYSPIANVMVHHPVADEVQETVQRELANRFELHLLVARGRRSIVYLARQLPGDQLVALKLLPFQGPIDASLVRAFEEAAEAASRLDHPHLTRVREYGVTSTLLWYATESVRARSLAQTLKAEGPRPRAEVLRIVEQAVSALDYLHRRELVHGDIKPTNVLVDPEGWARLTDAVVMHALERAAGAQSGWRPRLAPPYHAPELAAQGASTPAIDQYALAATAYEAMTGASHRPEGEAASEGRLRAAPNLTALAPETPAHVAAALERALAPMPIDRFGSIVDFADALAGARPSGALPRLAPTEPPIKRPAPEVFFPQAPRRPLPWKWIALVLVVLGGIGAYVALHRSTPTAEWATLEALPSDRAPSVVPGSASVAAPQGSTAVMAPTGAATAPPATRPRQTAPTRTPARVDSAALAPGHLSVNTTPWGLLYIDGALQGNTPVVNLSVSAGSHVVRVERSGFAPFERRIDVAPGQNVRLVDITLQPHSP